jgi:hypothetical protein
MLKSNMRHIAREQYLEGVRLLREKQKQAQDGLVRVQGFGAGESS